MTTTCLPAGAWVPGRTVCLLHSAGLKLQWKSVIRTGLIMALVGVQAGGKTMKAWEKRRALQAAPACWRRVGGAQPVAARAGARVAGGARPGVAGVAVLRRGQGGGARRRRARQRRMRAGRVAVSPGRASGEPVAASPQQTPSTTERERGLTSQPAWPVVLQTWPAVEPGAEPSRQPNTLQVPKVQSVPPAAHVVPVGQSVSEQQRWQASGWPAVAQLR